MFGIFKKKSPVEKLQDRYKKLMSEWHELSTTNRSASDLKYARSSKIIGRNRQTKQLNEILQKFHFIYYHQL